MRNVTKALFGAAGAVAAAAVAEKAAARRLRQRVDPELDPLFRVPDDVVHHRIATADGATLHAIERGEGRPLVLLHGVTLAAAIWSPQLRQLTGEPGRPGFRVIACDLRGHGESTAGTDGWGLPVLARDLATVLRELDLHDAIVAGHSMGGMTLMQFCADEAEALHERVAGVAFVATAAHSPLHPRVLDRAKVLGAKAIDRLDEGRPYPQLKLGGDLSLLVCRVAFGKEPTAAAVAQVRDCVEAMDPESFQRSWIGLLDHDVRETLSHVGIPADIVVGSRDLLTPVSAARTIAKLLPDAEFHLLPGCGHQVMQERPAELGRILRSLAARIEAPTARTA